MAVVSHCCNYAARVTTAALNSLSYKSSAETRSLNASITTSSIKQLKSSLASDSESITSFRNEFANFIHLASPMRGRLENPRRLRAVAMAATGESLPSLNDLPLINYINQQGRIVPPVEPGTEATVFAVFDMNKKIQYIGFSKDVRNSLRTLMGRRPELCYYFKLYNLQNLDQQLMLTIRQQWFSELGIPPAGNTDPIQRSYWEKPTDAGSISERGKAAAAQAKAKTLLQMMVDRGIKEEMVYNPELLAKGQCDILPSVAGSDDEASEEADSDSANKQHHVAIKSPKGDVVEFDITIEHKFITNGGWMYDVLISHEEKETRHRVICGKIYTKAAGIPEDEFIERVFAFLLHSKAPRRTEGVLAINQFAANYFSISEVAQKFENFTEWFDSELPDSYWRFNRLHSYGNETAPVSSLPSEMSFPKY